MAKVRLTGLSEWLRYRRQRRASRRLNRNERRTDWSDVRRRRRDANPTHSDNLGKGWGSGT